LLDFSYILFDVNRYDEEDLYRAANVIASVFYLDRVIDPRELVKRIKALAGVLKIMEPEQFRQVVVLTHPLREKVPNNIIRVS